MDTKSLIMVVRGSEAQDFDKIDLIEELMSGNVDFFDSLKELLEDDTDFSECITFYVSVTDYGTIENNPKFVSKMAKKIAPKKK